MGEALTGRTSRPRTVWKLNLLCASGEMLFNLARGELKDFVPGWVRGVRCLQRRNRRATPKVAEREITKEKRNSIGAQVYPGFKL